ncbi:MAG: TetR/AcrR family transcriptional regulator [Paracoccaceae bacterium]
MPDDMRVTTKERLLEAAKRLFAERGYAGASVRDICAEADAGRNMIHHYFGSKEALFTAILDDFSTDTFIVPLRIIAEPPTSQAEMVFQIEHFVRETLEALVGQRLVFKILVREQSPWQDLRAFRDGLVVFLKHAQDLGYVRREVNIEFIPSMILDRLGNQVLYAELFANSEADSIITNPEYRRKWVKDNVSLMLFGFVSPE